MSQDQAQSSSTRIIDSSPTNGRKMTDRWVSEAAYYIWEREGHQHGRDLDHWLRAEVEVRHLVNAGVHRKPVR
jgi:hypothetical protein